MLGVKFDKDRALAIVGSLSRGEPVAPAGEAWTRQDALMLAGACFLAVMSHGPEELRGVDPATIPLEHREAYQETLTRDLYWAVRWLAEATLLAATGTYDEKFEPVHEVRVDGAEPAVFPVSGVKDSLYVK